MNKIVWIFLILRATTKVSAFIESSEAIEVLDIKAALRSIQPILNEIDWRIDFIEKSPLERLEDRVQKMASLQPMDRRDMFTFSCDAFATKRSLEGLVYLRVQRSKIEDIFKNVRRNLTKIGKQKEFEEMSTIVQTEMLNATMKTPDRLMANLKRHVLDEFKTYVGYTLNYPETVGFVQNVMNVEDYKEKTFMDDIRTFHMLADTLKHVLYFHINEAFHFDRKLVRSNYIESLIRDDEPGLHRNYYVGFDCDIARTYDSKSGRFAFYIRCQAPERLRTRIVESRRELSEDLILSQLSDDPKTKTFKKGVLHFVLLVHVFAMALILGGGPEVPLFRLLARMTMANV